MGIYDRDYLRDSWEDRRPGFTSGWTATHWLIAANVAVFMLDYVTDGALARLLYLFPADVLHGRVWELVTSLFCHADFWHILFNMLFLWWLGSELEALYGSRRFLRIYFAGGIVASLTYVGGAWLQGLPFPALGASGAIMGVMVLYAFHFPRRQVLIYGIVPIEIRWMVVIYALIDLSGYLHHAGGVANASHLGGAAFGAAYALWERRR